MGVLVLRNHKPDAAVQHLAYDLKTGHFLTQSRQIVSRGDLANDLAFTHPILAEKPLTQIEKNQYSYSYHNDGTFFLALRYVYATLLQVENPALCSIRIQPAKQYLRDEQPYQFYFSCDPRKKAAQHISTTELNAMLRDIHQKPFQYCNRIVLDQTVTWRDLSQNMNADALYQTNSGEFQALNHQICLDQCEIRFINTQIGFGLFARTVIRKGSCITQYCGKYVPNSTSYKNYCYIPEAMSGYDLLLDSKDMGNVSRFVNHAPEPAANNIPTHYLTANVEVENHSRYGTARIMLLASRDIAPGEQLLLSYGDEYFRIPESILYLKKGSVVINSNHHRLKDNVAQLKRYLSVFASHGNRRAQWLLLRKPVIAFLLCIGVGFWLR